MASSATPLHDSLIELAILDAHAHEIKWYLKVRLLPRNLNVHINILHDPTIIYSDIDLLGAGAFKYVHPFVGIEQLGSEHGREIGVGEARRVVFLHELYEDGIPPVNPVRPESLGEVVQCCCSSARSRRPSG